MTNPTSAFASRATLPCGALVDPERGSMADEHHTPEAIAERVAWQLERFRVGQVVRRDDGCLVRLRSFEKPSVGGYIDAYGTAVDADGEARSGERSYRAGLLTRVSLAG